MTFPEFIKKRRYLFWDTKNTEDLSKEAAVERVLQYGNFEDVQGLIKTLKIKNVATIFQKQIRKKRVNYTPKIKHYFTAYFKKHGSQ